MSIQNSRAKPADAQFRDAPGRETKSTMISRKDSPFINLAFIISRMERQYQFVLLERSPGPTDGFRQGKPGAD